MVRTVPGDHRTLLERRMQILRNLLPRPDIRERRSHHQRQRDDPDVGIAGLNELRGLRNVFPRHQLALRNVPKPLLFERLARRPSVGSVLRIGDRNLRDLLLRDHREPLADIHRRLCRPEREPA